MDVDARIIQDLMHGQAGGDASCLVEISGRQFSPDSVDISKVSTPVKKRTRRGGVYFSDVVIYQARVRTGDLDIMPLITGAMLGPNPEFQDVVVTVRAGGRGVRLHANLTRSMEGAGFIELTLSITGMEEA